MSEKTLWDKVEKTPENIITKYNTDENKELNTIPSIHRFKKATEIFGIYGNKWGLKNLEHKELRVSTSLIIATLDAIFFCEYENQKIEFEISNSASIVSYKDKKYEINFSYRKSIETDTITKALSRLGFNADIYTDNDISEQITSELSKEDIVQFGFENE